MTKRVIKIGTRGSKLALYQAERVQKELNSKFPELQTELVVIQSKGDKILDVALSKITDKGLFTKELEDAMFRGEIDMAVHSLKDLPTSLPEGLTLGAVLERGEVRDAVVSAKGIKLDHLHSGIKLATSSLRRKAQVKKQFPEIEVLEIRGNVNTRIRKMEEGYCDAMIMAAVGLQRIHLDSYISEIIDPQIIIPAVSQGAIAIEIKEQDEEVKEILGEINHSLTQQITQAERVFLRSLEGGCQIPIGCYSSLQGDQLTMSGYMAYIDGTQEITKSISGTLKEADQLANQLAQYFIEQGSVQLLDKIRNTHI